MTDIRRPKNITTPKAEVRLDEARGFRGLYAREPIAKGELVWVSFVRPEDSDFLSWQDIKDAPEKVRYAYQIAADEFSLSKVIDADRSNYFNHACDPNTWYDESPATKVRAFVDFGLKVWAQDPKSPFHGAHVLDSLSKLFNDYVVGRIPTANANPLFDQARREFEETLGRERDIEYIVARRDIAAGEEITMDYAAFWVIADLEFECRCGAPTCRKQLRKTDYKAQDPAHVSHFVRGLLSAQRIGRAG